MLYRTENVLQKIRSNWESSLFPTSISSSLGVFNGQNKTIGKHVGTCLSWVNRAITTTTCLTVSDRG